MIPQAKQATVRGDWPGPAADFCLTLLAWRRARQLFSHRIVKTPAEEARTTGTVVDISSAHNYSRNYKSTEINHSRRNFQIDTEFFSPNGKIRCRKVTEINAGSTAFSKKTTYMTVFIKYFLSQAKTVTQVHPTGTTLAATMWKTQQTPAQRRQTMKKVGARS